MPVKFSNLPVKIKGKMAVKFVALPVKIFEKMPVKNQKVPVTQFTKKCVTGTLGFHGKKKTLNLGAGSNSI